MFDLERLTEEEFDELPLVVEGESKEVRYAGDGLVVIRFKPTIYSFTANRCGVVPGSDVLRLKASKIFLEVLREAEIRHSYRQVTDQWVLSRLVLQPVTAHDPHPFRPSDMTAEFISSFQMACPIEVIIKNVHTGASKHRYYRMAGHRVRASHPLYGRMEITDDDAYPSPIVRFDWRNPIKNTEGKDLADEILPDAVADWFINIERARATALRVADVLDQFLNERDIVCYDLCLFITEDGETVFSEISQDCGRFRHFNLGSLDKDVWRAGGSSDQVLQKWQILLDLLEGRKVAK